MADKKNAKNDGLLYKGHPLRRVDNLIYYGSMADKYIIMMQIAFFSTLADCMTTEELELWLDRALAGK